MSGLSLPIYNEDIQVLLNKVSVIESHKIITLILLISLSTFMIFNDIEKHQQ